MIPHYPRAEVDRLRVQLSETTDPELLRDALESVLDFMDRVADQFRYSDDAWYITTNTRRLTRLALAGQNEHGVTPLPEIPSD